MRAAKPARVAELDELDAAQRALAVHQAGFLALGELPRFAGLLPRGLLLLRVVEILMGTLLAQVQLLELFLTQDFGDVQGGRFRTLLALHRRGSPM